MVHFSQLHHWQTAMRMWWLIPAVLITIFLTAFIFDFGFIVPEHNPTLCALLNDWYSPKLAPRPSETGPMHVPLRRSVRCCFGQEDFVGEHTRMTLLYCRRISG